MQITDNSCPEDFYTMGVEEIKDKFASGQLDDMFIPFNQFVIWLGLENEIMQYLRAGKLAVKGEKFEGGYKNLHVTAKEAIRFMVENDIVPKVKTIN